MNSETGSKAAANKRRLTELFVRRLTPTDRPYMVWDTQQRGLAIRVQPTGSKSWKAIYSHQGRPRWFNIGDANAIGLAEARTIAADVRLQVARGSDPAAERRAQRDAGTFAELAEKYLEQHAKRKNKSWRQADALVRRYTGDLSKLKASTITRADIKETTRRIEAPILANQALAAVSAIFSWAVKEELLSANPCKLVPRNATKSRERVLAQSELPRFWSAFDDAGLIAGTALKAILLLGQRPGEVAHMRYEHLRDDWWEMPGEPVSALGWPGTKNGASHRIWLPAALRALLSEIASEDISSSGFVFADRPGRPVRDLDAAMRMACSKLAVERATPHDLRRTHGSTITAMGFGRDIMNRIQNHKEGGISSVHDRYSYEREIKHVMEAVADRIVALAECHTEAGKVVPFGR
jgi:integrase